MNARGYNLYFVSKPKPGLHSLYYIGDEDGVWPCRLVKENGKDKIVRTSQILVPFENVQFNVTQIKPGKINPNTTAGEENYTISDAEWEDIAEGMYALREALKCEKE